MPWELVLGSSIRLELIMYPLGIGLVHRCAELTFQDKVGRGVDDGMLCGAQLEAWLGAGGAAAALHEDVYGPLTGQACLFILHHLCVAA